MMSYFPVSLVRRSAVGISLLLLLIVLPVSAQSVESVVSAMEDTYRSQMESVDTYILETDMYTSYHRKVEGGDAFSMENVTQVKGQESMPMQSTPVTGTNSMIDLSDDLRQHATYSGSETLDGTRCHVLTIDDPSQLKSGMAGSDIDQIRYFVNADTHQPRRMVVSSSSGGPSTMTVDMLDYRTVKGLSMPHRMEFTAELPPEQRKQMEAAFAQLEQMPPEQREQAMQMMGDQMQQMKNMMSGEPMVVTVTSLKVNVPLPDGIFDGS